MGSRFDFECLVSICYSPVSAINSMSASLYAQEEAVLRKELKQVIVFAPILNKSMPQNLFLISSHKVEANIKKLRQNKDLYKCVVYPHPGDFCIFSFVIIINASQQNWR